MLTRNERQPLSPRMQITYDVLERAKDCEDHYIIACCRAVIVADRLGWRKYNGSRYFNIVCAFDQLNYMGH